MLKLISHDGKEFEMSYDSAQLSTLLKPFADNECEQAIPLSDSRAMILEHILIFCDHHKNDVPVQPSSSNDDDDFNGDIYESRRTDDIGEWDRNFISQFTTEDGTLFEMIKAANYMGIKTLLEICCKTVANMIRGKNEAELREILKIPKDPPEEDANRSN